MDDRELAGRFDRLQQGIDILMTIAQKKGDTKFLEEDKDEPKVRVGRKEE